MAYVQAGLAVKVASSTDDITMGAGGDVYTHAAGAAEATNGNPTQEQHRLIRREHDSKTTIGVHSAGSFHLMRSSLPELTTGPSASVPTGVAATDGVAAADLQSPVVAQSGVSLEAALATSVMKKKTADVSTTLLQQTGDTHSAMQAANAVAAALPAVPREVADDTQARSTVAVAAPGAESAPDSGMAAAAPATTQLVPVALYLGARLRFMLQLIDHSASLENHIPLMICLVMLLVTAIVLGCVWHFKRTAPDDTYWHKEHQYLVNLFEEKTKQATTHQATTSNPMIGLRSSISEPEKEVQQQPSWVESLKTLLRPKPIRFTTDDH